MAIFDDAISKINRAKTHIHDVKARVQSLQVSNTSRIDINPETGGEILVHDISDTAIFDDIALPLGDAVHNLNCALDYVWLQTIEVLAPSLIDDRAKMPVRKYAKEVEGWLTKAAGIDSSSNLFKFIVDTIKPYSGGNDAIWAIHNFDIRDKHRLLIPILSQGWITGIVVVDQRGERWPGSGASEFQRPPYVIAFEPGLHVKEKGELAVDIVVTDEKSGCEMSVPEELSIYAEMISRTVVLFKTFLKSEAGV
jgi:hypothetical protein